MSDKQLRCLSDRINYALETRGISKAELARRIGVKPQTIQYLCSTKAESSKFTFELAHALGINFEWLAVGMGDIGLHDDVNTFKSNEVAYTFNDLQAYLKTSPISFDQLKYPLQLQLQDQSMWPRFPQGTLLVFDQNASPKNASFVLVYLQSINDIVFRELIEQDSKKILVPFNANLFKEVILQEADKILGTLVEARWRVES